MEIIIEVSTVVLFAVSIIILLAVIIFIKSPKTKGAVGELVVGLSLGKDIPNEKYVINDLLLYHNRKSYQIDHIVIRKTGVFVIETKNYSGQIYGQENQKWTQVLAGQRKTSVLNPFKIKICFLIKMQVERLLYLYYRVSKSSYNDIL